MKLAIVRGYVGHDLCEDQLASEELAYAEENVKGMRSSKEDSESIGKLFRMNQRLKDLRIIFLPLFATRSCESSIDTYWSHLVLISSIMVRLT
ncbi:hypothetical protein D9Q81_08355 [Candidatus Korarchaeum cryptofilum]|uniref:Uncharacterized protein n=1 Tax=Candidatus Korarchaeum cryptofilum TaxID=498846 RepID=A0A3R9QXS1_9CREN|nr:hypothetical protein D9Q81_08355 [Candidatus Korarchaeum cryptofilum]